MKKPFANIEQTITMASVNVAMARFSIASELILPLSPTPPVASVIAVPAKLIPITTITGPVITGGKSF